VAGLLDPVHVQQRRSRRRRPARRDPEQLHIFSFIYLAMAGHRQAVTVLVRGTMGQDAAVLLAGTQARARMPGGFCTGINTVPAPRPTPALDTLVARHTAFPTFLTLLTAAGGYRPSIRLDLLGRDGLALARAYDRQQAAWGDPRRAFVSGDLPPRRP
jgi:hypothetical protein